MISWIQKTFQQHFRTIFLVLLALVIISFVFTIGVPGVSNSAPKALEQPFFGLNLGKAEDQRRVFEDANLSVFLQVGYPALEGARLQEFGLQRFAGIALANQLHVPAPSENELKEFMKSLRAFAGENGQFDPERYKQFRESLKLGRGLKEADVARVLEDDFRYNRVQKLLGGPGYVLPSDVKQQLARTDTAWTLNVATVDYSSFNPALKPTDADLAKFFESNGFRYEIPPQIRARLVEFPIAAFLAQVSVTDADVRAYFDANPARFPKPVQTGADGKPVAAAPSTPDSDFAAVRTQVEAALKTERARTLANKAATDTSLAIYEGKVAREALDGFLSSLKLKAQPLPAFSRDNLPAVLGTSPEVASEALKLSDQHYYSEAVSIPTGAALLLWEESIPSRTPQLAEIRAKVLADYTENEKRSRFVDLGRSVRSTIEARLKAGDSFEKAVQAAASSGAKIETKAIPSFTFRTRPQDLDYSVLGTLENLNKGAVSDMVISGDKGFLVHAAEKAIPAVTDADPKYTETRNQLAQYIAANNANDYLRDIVEKEIAKWPATAR